METHVARPLAVPLAVLLLALAGCGGAGSPSAATGNGRGLQGLILTPAKQAPRLALRNYTGGLVDLRALHGKAVLVTFVYTHCPDVCPLIVSNLALAQRELGAAARRLQIVAVTVDPRRDTPAAVARFLAERDASGRVDYLLGTPSQLARVWREWEVAVRIGNPTASGHSAIVYGITASGKMAVVYPSSFSPAELTHDVPLLARS